MMDTLMKDQAMKTRYGIALKDGVNKTGVLAYSEECREKYGFKKSILDENADDPIFFIVTSDGNRFYRANSNYIGFATPDSAQRDLDSLEDRFRELLEVREVCAKGGVCEWGTDGAHSNEFCKKCFRTKSADVN